jgi:hypothetical protein
MTHAEMWDDSTLVDSWNEALDEYKVRNWSHDDNVGANTSEFYHSIHARGEKVEDILRAHDDQNSSLLVLVFDFTSCPNNLMLTYLTN